MAERILCAAIYVDDGKAHHLKPFRRQKLIIGQAAPEHALETAACTATTKSGEPCHVANDVKDGLCHIHRRALVAA